MSIAYSMDFNPISNLSIFSGLSMAVEAVVLVVVVEVVVLVVVVGVART